MKLSDIITGCVVLARVKSQKRHGTSRARGGTGAVVRTARAGVFFVGISHCIGYTISMGWTGTTAIITGAGGQLGGAIAVSLAGRGMACACHYHRSGDRAAEVVAAIGQAGGRAVAVQADLTDAGAAETIFRSAETLGPVRVLVNSASVFQRQPLETFDAAEVASMLAVNLTAPLMLCHEFASCLRRQGVDVQNADDTLASIINMVDVAGVKPWGRYSPYCASRAGLIGMTKSLARELAPAVTVNAIAPGIVTWPGQMDPAEEQKQLAMIPAARFGRPADITRTIDFLLDNPYITGQVVCVDGGRSI